MRKTVIILTILALITSSCATKKYYYREITRVYFTNKSGRELVETLSGMPMRICIESKKTDIINTKELTKSERRMVKIEIKAPDGRKFKNGSEVLIIEAKVNRKGKACKEIIIEYEELISEEEINSQTENDAEILEMEVLEFNLNDLYSVRLRQISENEYTDRKKETEHLSHKPYKVITDIAEAKKKLKKRLKGFDLQDYLEYSYYQKLEISYKGGIKKLFNVAWFGWDNKYHNFIAYYPEAGVLILNHEADGDFPIDLNDSNNEHTGNPKYYSYSPDKQFRINGNFDGGATDGIRYWLEKWNSSNRKYEFVGFFRESIDFAYPIYGFCFTGNWFWTSNSKVIFTNYAGKENEYFENTEFYEMELIEK